MTTRILLIGLACIALVAWLWIALPFARHDPHASSWEWDYDANGGPVCYIDEKGEELNRPISCPPAE